MRHALALGIFLALSTAAYAEPGVPSEGVLADMGLSGLAILSDIDALEIRGDGFPPNNLSDRIAQFHQRIAAFHVRVGDFKNRVAAFQHKLHP
jgi:hypothetical protein